MPLGTVPKRVQGKFFLPSMVKVIQFLGLLGKPPLSVAPVFPLPNPGRCLNPDPHQLIQPRMQEPPSGSVSLPSGPFPLIHSVSLPGSFSKAGLSLPDSCVKLFSGSSCQQEKVPVPVLLSPDSLSRNTTGSFGMCFLSAQILFSNLVICTSDLLNSPFQACPE